jgi:hypothetical protein
MTLTIALAVVAAASAYFAWRFHQAASRSSSEASEIRSKYSTIIDLAAEVQKQNAELDRLKQMKVSEETRSLGERSTLAEEYRLARSKYEELRSEVRLLEENLEDMSFGVYKPHFSFQTSEEYKVTLTTARDRARQLVRDGRATDCPVAWTVGNSRKDGERMVKQYTKLQLRAFNGECEAALANVAWNNVTKMEERVKQSFAKINELGGVMQVRITAEYLSVKIDELRLSHELEQKKYEEREEQRRIREEIREEEKAKAEFEKARIEAEREEERYRSALEKARTEAARTTGEQLTKLTEKIASLETKIDEAQNRKERAIARAQLTKTGFVYVISNIGSFGEKVYKIGMTRRMEPMDRIAELGDASVPFGFDLHVMLYSDNAPELEGALHQLFEQRRVNMVNRRKEFYRDVELEEIERFVKTRGLSAQFIKVAEAKEYRQTQAIAEERKLALTAAAQQAQTIDQFPETLFHSAAAQSHRRLRRFHLAGLFSATQIFEAGLPRGGIAATAGSRAHPRSETSAAPFFMIPPVASMRALHAAFTSGVKSDSRATENAQSRAAATLSYWRAWTPYPTCRWPNARNRGSISWNRSRPPTRAVSMSMSLRPCTTMSCLNNGRTSGAISKRRP